MPFPKQQWFHTFDTVSLGWMQGRLLSAEVESRKEMDLLKEINGAESGWEHVLHLWVLSGRGAQACIRRW